MKLADAGLETVLLFDEGVESPTSQRFRSSTPTRDAPRSGATTRPSSSSPRRLPAGAPDRDGRTAPERRLDRRRDPRRGRHHRRRGRRANASTLSHAELHKAKELDAGDPADLAERYVGLRRELPGLDVVGGCCGTDIRHVTAICDAWLAADAPS